MNPVELRRPNLTEWGHPFRRKKRRHTPLLFPPPPQKPHCTIAILNQSRWYFAYAYALNMTSCQNHLSLINIHCRSQTLMSFASKVGSSEISESLLNSAAWLFVFRKTNFFLFQTSITACHAPLFRSCNYSCNLCRLSLWGSAEEYIQYPKSQTLQCYQIFLCVVGNTIAKKSSQWTQQ